MEPSRIIGDPDRQATDSIGGYLYQFWQTLLVWLDLKSSEYLYIEGAEDFDLVSVNGATSVQVKRTTAAVSLNSESILKTISNYWSIKELNPDRPIQYRFITTSGIAQEQHSPFGQRIRGLTLWNSCSNESDAKKILDHLQERAEQTDSSISEPLKLWLRSALAREVLDELIKPIRWLVNAPAMPDIERAIEEKLIYLGENIGLQASESKRAKEQLLIQISRLAASTEPPPLTRARLLEEFEGATSISIPLAYHRASLARLSPSITQGFDHPSLLEDVPPTPSGISKRGDFCRSVIEVLNSSGFVFLQGSSGMGKSTIAKLIVNAVGGSWVWINLSERRSAELIRIVRFIILESGYRSTHLVLDDLRFLDDSVQALENALSGLLTLLRERNNKLIITSQYELPQALILRLDLANEIKIDAPSFDKREIAELIATNGYQGESIEYLSKTLLIQTSGHPQLLHSRVRTLAQNNWKLPNLDEIFTKQKDIQAVKQDVSIALSAILSTDQRELLYRLSLVSSSFRKGDALRIGSLHQAIQRPGEVFDILVGPWIEQRTNNRYAVSALLKDSARDIWSAKDIERLHCGIVAAIISTGSMDQYDSMNVFFHAWQGKDYASLIKLAYNLIAKNGEEFRRVAEFYHFITFIGVKEGNTPILDNPMANNYFRMLQFKVATEVDRDSTSLIAVRWYQELLLQEPSNKTVNETASYALEKIGFAYTILNSFQASVTVEILAAAFIELHNAIKLAKTLTGDLGRMITEAIDFLEHAHVNKLLPEFIETTDPFQMFFIFVSMRKLNGAELLDLFSKVETFPEELRARLLSAHDSHAESARMLIENVWLEELSQGEAEPISYIEILEKIRLKVDELGDMRCAMECVRSIATIYDEYVRDCDAALSYLEKAEAYNNRYPVAITDKKAMILFHKGDLENACYFWKEVIPQMPLNWSTGDPWSIYSCRFAAITAAKLNDWVLSAQFFEEGKKRSEFFLYGTEHILAFQVDFAYALWKAGKRDESIRNMLEVGRAFLEMDKVYELPEIYTVYRLFCHVFTWMTMVSGENGKGTLDEPVVGMCSNPEKHPGIKDLPFVPFEMVKALIVRCSTIINVSLDHAPYKNYIEELKRSPNPMVRTMVFFTEFDRILKSGNLDDLIVVFYNTSKYGRMHSEMLIDDDKIDWLDLEKFIFSQRASLIIPTVLAASARGIELSSILSSWRDKISIFKIIKGIEQWIEAIDELWYDESIYLYKHIAKYNEADERAVAALKLTYSERTEINNMFYSQLCVFETLSQIRGKNVLYLLLEIRIYTYWKQVAEHPFLINCPAIMVAEFQKVFDDDSHGERKIARILLVARDAIGARNLSSESLARLRLSAGYDEKNQQYRSSENTLKSL